MNTGFGEFGVVIEVMNTIKEDVRELKIAVLDPDNGMAGRVKILENELAELKEERAAEAKSRAEEAKTFAEMQFSYGLLKWAVTGLGGVTLTGFAALVAKALWGG